MKILAIQGRACVRLCVCVLVCACVCVLDQLEKCNVFKDAFVKLCKAVTII